MRRLVYIVIAASTDGDNFYDIDSIWTSDRKAKKRCNELNSVGAKNLMETRKCGLFEVIQKYPKV